jgi:hypothetical protein
MTALRKKTVAGAQDLPSLRKVLPVYPTDVLEYEALSKNLIRMGCSGLLNWAWGFREEHMIRDFMGDLSNVAGRRYGRRRSGGRSTDSGMVDPD